MIEAPITVATAEVSSAKAEAPAASAEQLNQLYQRLDTVFWARLGRAGKISWQVLGRAQASILLDNLPGQDKEWERQIGLPPREVPLICGKLKDGRIQFYLDLESVNSLGIITRPVFKGGSHPLNKVAGVRLTNNGQGQLEGWAIYHALSRGCASREKFEYPTPPAGYFVANRPLTIAQIATLLSHLPEK